MPCLSHFTPLALGLLLAITASHAAESAASADFDIKKLLLADLDKFNAAFVEKLATFALRRAMSVDDRTALHDLAKQSKAADCKLPVIIEALVMSELFQKR